jgi:hypothetical protein
MCARKRPEGCPLTKATPAARPGSSALEIANARSQAIRHHAAEPQPYTIARQTQGRWWEVRDAAGALVCLTVYRRGAREVVRRLSVATA